MNEVQMERPSEIISRISRPVHNEWKIRSRGYSLRKPGATQFGFVRFIQRGDHAGKYVIYVRQPFSDPRQLFVETRGGREGEIFVDPKDESAICYAISALESAWDER